VDERVRIAYFLETQSVSICKYTIFALSKIAVDLTRVTHTENLTFDNILA
jgi:hypothetical protein